MEWTRPACRRRAAACEFHCKYTQYFAARPGSLALSGVRRKCKRFSNKSMLRTTSPAQISTSRGGMGEAQGRSAAALPSKHPEGRADAERQCETTPILLLRYSYRRNARDPSHRTSSTRSSRTKKVLYENNIFRHNMRYFPWSRNYTPM